MFKKVLLSIASLFLIWQSYKLVGSLDALQLHTWWQILLVAWLINLFITGIFAFLGFAFPTQKILPTKYYEIHNTKRLKRTYQFLQVEWFRKALLATLWKSKKQRQKYFNGKKEGLGNLITQSQKSEIGHLFPLIVITLICIYLFVIGDWKLASVTLLINIIGNLYPIILQRQHRRRIQILKKRYAGKS